MRLLLLISTIFLSCNFVWSQEKRIEIIERSERISDHPEEAVEHAPPDLIIENDPLPADVVREIDLDPAIRPEKQEFSFLKAKTENSLLPVEHPLRETIFDDDSIDSGGSQTNGVEKFHWKPALIQSFYFLGIQHSLRMIQKKTRRELTGPFFRDWGTSVRSLSDWRDGDGVFTNYVAHPMQGAVTGWIFINNSERARRVEFGNTWRYWETRLKTLAWSAVWSTQFELGPFGEAAIGNVGLYDKVGPNRMGWVDLIMTPVAGTGIVIGEDIIDKYILRRWLERDSSRTRTKIFRTFFTPFRSFVNVLGGRVPWKRYDR